MPAQDTVRGVSRMRAHKGNVPSLPQTKQCTLCPAKFTRTTHLNRHLRSHTNERLHRCNLCKNSEFTRSDLLTRHKRTCGQNINRSRRKSCEACAESKIKCNLQYPCAKCTSRGRECVFQNDPEESRTKNLSSKAGCRKAATSSETHCSISPAAVDDRSLSPEASSSTSSTSPSSGALSLPALSDSDASSASSIQSPRSEDFMTFEEQNAFDFPFNVGIYEDPLASMLSPFDQRPFSCGSPTFLSSAMLDEAKPDTRDSNSNGDHDIDLFTSLIRSPDPPSGMLGGALTNLMISHPVSLDRLGIQSLSRAQNQTLETYLHLFFTRFLTQVPLIHAPTWKMADTPPTLRRIFHACGALFVKTPEAAAFVEATLASVTVEISEQFNTVNAKSNNSDASASASPHTHLILSLVLLQTIYLFQREGGGIAPSNVEHHAMLVAMIRQTGLIERVGSWIIPDWTNAISLEAAWMEWIQFATIKRALLLAYFHDCCHCMYSASPPGFSPAELNVHLPCDDALWRAHSAEEWSSVAHTPSPYGVGSARIYGVSMQRALTALTTPTGHSGPGPTARGANGTGRLQLPPFALFILIHTVLRNISVAQRAPPPGGWSCFALVATQPGGADFLHNTQILLDNWLQLWLTCPEATPPGPDGAAPQEPPFVANSLPFYWLAQVSLWETSAPGHRASLAPIPNPLITAWGGQPPSLGARDPHSSDGLRFDKPGRLLDEMVVDPRVSL